LSHQLLPYDRPAPRLEKGSASQKQRSKEVDLAFPLRTDEPAAGMQSACAWPIVQKYVGIAERTWWSVEYV
jgi:hypothetical protein